jgi:hypothetical protein
MLAVQYLEYSPDVSALSSSEVRACLQSAFKRLPIDCVILGWDLPEALIEACAEEVERADAHLYHWHPLLTGSSTFDFRSEWQVIGLDGERVPGFEGLPEFTFLCPNRQDAADLMLENFVYSLRKNWYDGVFLDRIRYPSPTVDPGRFLACFCTDCIRAAADEGLDIADARQRIQSLLSTPERLPSFVKLLLDPCSDIPSDDDPSILRKFLDFRMQSISRFVRKASDMARNEGLTVGLDCFSPALVHMVGQDLAALNDDCDWIKIMTYGHTLAPAGVPFELQSLATWLIDHSSVCEADAINWLAQAAHIPLPPDLKTLAANGVSPEGLASEVERARDAGVSTLLAGIELVELEGVTQLNESQIKADLRTFLEAGSDGLVLSWDLRKIPPEYLDIVRGIWDSPKASQ